MDQENRANVRILVAEAQFNMRCTIRNMLQKMEYRHIDEAEDGKEAWAKMQAEE